VKSKMKINKGFFVGVGIALLGASIFLAGLAHFYLSLGVVGWLHATTVVTASISIVCGWFLFVEGMLRSCANLRKRKDA